MHDANNCDLKKEVRISVHLNVAKEINVEECNDIEYHHYPIIDCHPFHRDFIDSITYMISQKIPDNTILVTCASGISRSPAVLLCYLYQIGFDLDSALMLLLKRRPIVNIHPNILKSIKDHYGIEDTYYV